MTPHEALAKTSSDAPIAWFPVADRQAAACRSLLRYRPGAAAGASFHRELAYRILSLCPESDASSHMAIRVPFCQDQVRWYSACFVTRHWSKRPLHAGGRSTCPPKARP